MFFNIQTFARTLQIVQNRLEHIIRKGKIQDCPGTQGQEGDKGRSSPWHCSRVLSFLKRRLEDEQWCYHKKQTNRKEKKLNVLNKFATSSWPGFLPIFGFMHLVVRHICKVSQGWRCSEFVFTVIFPFPCHPPCSLLHGRPGTLGSRLWTKSLLWGEKRQSSNRIRLRPLQKPAIPCSTSPPNFS